MSIENVSIDEVRSSDQKKLVEMRTEVKRQLSLDRMEIYTQVKLSKTKALKKSLARINTVLSEKRLATK